MKSKYCCNAQWFLYIAIFTTSVLSAADLERCVRVPLLIDANGNPNSGQPDQSGLAKLWSEIVKSVQCLMATWKAGSQPLDHVASYTRHKKVGNCCTYVGNFVHEYDAHSCPDHADAQVTRLLDICWRAVTYHLPTGEIYVVEADPIQGKRNGLQGGPHAQRVTEKPHVHSAQVCKAKGIAYTQRLATSKPLYYVRLLDSSNRTLIESAVFEPLHHIETEAGTLYELDKHTLNKVHHDVDMNEVRTAVEVDDWVSHRQ